MKKNERWILFTLVITCMMAFLDTAILPVALPTIQQMLHSSTVQLQWMVNSYLLAGAIFVATGGKLGDIFGHRRIFCAGISLFGLSSALCGLSQTNWELITFRFFQGIGSALMIPTSLALLCETFSEKRRGKALGIVTSAGSVALGLGPVIGGFFTQYLSWHYIFYINVPIAIISLISALYFISKSPKLKVSIDYLGFMSFTGL